MSRTDFAVWVGFGEHVTEELFVPAARDDIEAAQKAADILDSEYSNEWHIIDVMPYRRKAHGHSRTG